MPPQSNKTAAKAEATAAASASPATPGAAAAATPATAGGEPAAKAPAKPAIPTLGRSLRAWIGPESARLDLFAGLRQPRVYASQQAEYRPGVATLPEAIESVESLLAALTATTGPLKGLRCDFVIADAWLLYDVVRADLRSLSPRAADDVVRSALADMAGVPPSDLATRWATQGGGRSTLACGMPAPVLPSIRSLLERSKLRAGSIVGEFVHEYNAHREQLAARCAVISLVRETGAQLAISTDGVVTAMSFELGVRAPEELEQRARGLLRGAGHGAEADAKFFALLPAGWNPPAPWIGLALTA